jgi:hypothetical protein
MPRAIIVNDKMQRARRFRLSPRQRQALLHRAHDSRKI